MKRKFLEDLGLEKDAIDQIMAENGRDVEAAKGDLNAVTTERDNLKKDVDDRDKQINDLKKSAGNNQALLDQIAQLQAENKATKLNNAVEKALTAAKALNITAAKALLKDLDKAELAEDGTVKGLDEQIKALQKDDGTKFLFAVENKETKNKFKGASPAESGDNKPKGITKEQFGKMGYKERLDLFNKDRELYDTLNGTTPDTD